MPDASVLVIQSISVKELVEFVWRRGDLRSGRQGGPSAMEGALGHRWLQKKRAGFETERFFKQTVVMPNIQLTISGRADAICTTTTPPLIEEMKTTLESPLLIRGDNSVHWGQAKIYAYMLAKERGDSLIEVCLTYLNVETRDTRQFNKRFTYDALRIFFDKTVEAYVAWIHRVATWQGERNQMLLRLPFPFEIQRNGQREMADQVQQLTKKKGALLIEAPCGVGKSMSVLFGAVKGLAHGHVGQILCLTAKTMGAVSAETAVRQIAQAGTPLKAIVLMAKERLCLHPTRNACDNNPCPLAKGHYDRLSDARTALFSRPDMSVVTVAQVAKAHDLCPYWLTRAMVPYADVIILDYNYFFDPRASLSSLTAMSKPPKLLLVDEAHNLPDRAREMFSASLCDNTLRQLKESGALGKSLTPLVTELRRTMATVVHDTPLTSLEETSPGFLDTLSVLIEEIETQLARLEEVDQEHVLQPYFELLAFSRAANRESASDRLIVKKQGRRQDVTIFAVDPAAHLSRVLSASGASVCYYSATLSPVAFFKRLLCGETEADTLILPSAFPPTNRKPLIAAGISTRYRDRPSSRHDVAAVISHVVRAKQGNYLAFFPSFAYLDAVADVLMFGETPVSLSMQRPGFNDAEKRSFLKPFCEQRPDEWRLGLAVLGGLFSEGIDLPGEQLIGAMMVSPGLPVVTENRQLIRRHYDDTLKDGYGFAYVYPGMNRVVQAAGRVIRSATDKGVLVFIGDRFGTRPYLPLLEQQWPDVVRVESSQEIETQLTLFWKPPKSEK